MSNVTKNKNELYKTTIAIRFSLLEVCPSLPPFVIAFFKRFEWLFSCFAQFSDVSHCLNFVTQLL